MGPEGFFPLLFSTRRRNPLGSAQTCWSLQSPAPVRPTRKCCPQVWLLQPRLSPWGRSQVLTRQPHPQCGNVEVLEGPSRVFPQPQTVANLALDPALAQPAQYPGPVRTFGHPGDAHHQVTCDGAFCGVTGPGTIGVRSAEYLHTWGLPRENHHLLSTTPVPGCGCNDEPDQLSPCSLAAQLMKEADGKGPSRKP